MISDFKHLSQKIGQLAELSHSLHRENAELRAHIAMLNVENSDLNYRMQAAYERVSGLLSELPNSRLEANTAQESNLQQETGHQAIV